MRTNLFTISTITTISLSSLPVVLSAPESYNEQLASLCNLSENLRAVVNPDFDFQPLPQELLGCDLEFCFCKIDGASSGKCPWELAGYVSGTYPETSKNEYDAGESSAPATFCLGAQSTARDITPVLPNLTEMGCGVFVYSQAGEAGNWFSKDDNVMSCPTSWGMMVESGASWRVAPGTMVLMTLSSLALLLF
jgi:hypothetical protein